MPSSPSENSTILKPMSNEYEFSNIEAFRKLMITVQQTKDLIAWLDSFDIDWYIQKDITGRL